MNVGRYTQSTPHLPPGATVQEPVAGACFAHIPRFLSAAEADESFRLLETELPWKHLAVKVFGKTRWQPRLTHYAADPGLSYAYAGLMLPSSPWTEPLKSLRDQIEVFTQWSLNAVLCNFYRNGQDSMGWHADDEKELGPEPAIASLSFGGMRDFKVRLKRTFQQSVGDRRTSPTVLSFRLGHGDLLLMWGQSQSLTQHCVPRSASLNEPRINLTFRYILGPDRI